tara:strand:+ start:105 stop:599 length:495 start_codon:yes stop_codon:yes gene_type:complete
LISCAELSNATDIFRVTSESPFLFFDPVEELWKKHIDNNLDATFYDDVIDGIGFEIISLKALNDSYKKGDERHRSELCTLYIRENLNKFKVGKPTPPKDFIRKDLRLTVDNPEDLVVCRILYNEFRNLAPRFPIRKLIKFLDDNPNLKKLIYPFTEQGYVTMYI